MSVANLLAAMTESVIVKRPTAAIARHFRVEAPGLHAALLEISAISYRGQLETALARPDERPDLMPTRIHLARLEEHYAILMRQFDRADLRCHDIEHQEGGYHDAELQKAELLANRIHQQIQRNLKEMRKAELELQKLLASPPESANTVLASRRQKSPESEPTPTEKPSMDVTAKTDAQPTGSHEQAITVPAPEEFKNIILRHRDRIKNTRAEDRPALIARLINEHRAKNHPSTGQDQPNLPSPSQNGKHAA